MVVTPVFELLIEFSIRVKYSGDIREQVSNDVCRGISCSLVCPVLMLMWVSALTGETIFICRFELLEELGDV